MLVERVEANGWRSFLSSSNNERFSIRRELPLFHRANEVAGCHTEGHFDLPLRGYTIALDGVTVVEGGALRGGLE